MPDVIIGSRFMEPVPLQGYPVMRREGGKWTKEERFLVNKATLAQFIPEHDSLDTAQNLFGVDLYCNSAEVTQRCEEGFEDVCEVRIEWGYEIQSSDYSGAPGISGKKVTYNSQSSFEEKDIKEHPAYKERTDQEKKDLETFTNTSDKEAAVFYVGAYNNLFGIYQYTSTRVGFFTSLCTGAGYDGYVTIGVNPFTNNLNTKHTLVIRVIGTKVTFILDDQVLYENAAMTRKTSTLNPAGVSAGAGYLHNVKITNLTKNKVLWSYPSWPEKVRLMTYNNITTANGAFEAANITAARWVATQLDFRNRATDFTLLVKFRVPKHSPDGKAHLSSLLSQGNVYWGDRDRCVCGIWVTEDYRGTTPVFNVAGSPTVRFDVSADFFGRDHVIALTAAAADNRSRLYLDGALTRISDASRPALPLSAATLNPGDNSVLKIGAQTDSFYYSEPVIYSALVYDFALTEQQIAAISKQI